MQIVKSLLVEEEGAEIAEYALLVVILALGLLTAAPNFQSALANAFTKTGTKVSTNADSPLLS
jgi:Flp pilus assembly pilin Flp